MVDVEIGCRFRPSVMSLPILLLMLLVAAAWESLGKRNLNKDEIDLECFTVVGIMLFILRQYKDHGMKIHFLP